MVARAPKATLTPDAVTVEVEAVNDSAEVILEVTPVETKTVKLTYDGRVYDVEVLEIDGRNLVQKSVYKEVPLPYSKRTTKFLVVAAGTYIR